MTGRGAGRGVCDLGQPSLLSRRQFCHSLNEANRQGRESVRRSEAVTSCRVWETQGFNAGIRPHRNGSVGGRAEHPRRDGPGGKAVTRGSLPPLPAPQAPPLTAGPAPRTKVARPPAQTPLQAWSAACWNRSVSALPPRALRLRTEPSSLSRSPCDPVSPGLPQPCTRYTARRTRAFPSL